MQGRLVCQLLQQGGRKNKTVVLTNFVVTGDVLNHVSYRFNFVRSCVQSSFELALYANYFNLVFILIIYLILS